MRPIILLLLLVLPAAPAQAGRFTGLAAGILAMHANAVPAPTPQPPRPQPGVCSNCRGTGKVGDGRVMVTCPVCNGTGKITQQSTAPPSAPTVSAPQRPLRMYCDRNGRCYWQ